MRFFVLFVFVALLVLAGLFVYGQMLEPKQTVIEQEAVPGGAAN